jgi:hypothetical protein
VGLGWKQLRHWRRSQPSIEGGHSRVTTKWQMDPWLGVALGSRWRHGWGWLVPLPLLEARSYFLLIIHKKRTPVHLHIINREKVVPVRIYIFLDSVWHYKVWKVVKLGCDMSLENYMLLASLTDLAHRVGHWSDLVAFSSSPTPRYVRMPVWYLGGRNETCTHKCPMQINPS